MRPFFALFLPLLLALLPGAVSAQSNTPALSIDYTLRSSALRRSSNRWSCQPVHILLLTPTSSSSAVTVDLIKYPYPTAVDSQEVVSNVASNVTAVEGRAEVWWQPSGKKDMRVVMRAMDGQGNVAYTAVRRIKDGDSDDCTDLDPNWARDNAWVIVLIILLSLYFLSILLAINGKRQKERQARMQQEEIALGGVVQPR
ncbi:hypothetical protein JCM10213_007602 [Rhodosporidiobolus nylandii]